MVALGALDAHAQEDLAERPAHLLRRRQRLVDGGGPLVGSAAAGRQDVAGKLVVGAVRRELLPQPAGHGHRPGRRDGVAIDAQQVGPTHGPVVGVFGSLKELIDQPGPFVGARVGQEGPRLGHGRQRADRVEEDTAQEGGVVGQFAGRNAQAGQVVPGQAVDEIGLRRTRELHTRPGEGHAADGDMPQVADQDGGLAGDIAPLNPAAHVHRGDRSGVGIVLGIEGDTVAGAIGPKGRDTQLLCAAQAEHLLARLDFDSRDGRGADPEASAFDDPAAQALIGERIRSQSPAAAMRQPGAGLEQ